MKKITALGFTLFFVFGLMGCNSPEVPSDKNTDTKNKPNVVSTETEKTSWKTYKNDAGGFSINYPEGYTSKEDSGKQIYVTFKKDEKSSFVVKAQKTESENTEYRDAKSTGSIKLGNLEAKQYDFPNGYCDGPGCSLPFIAVKAYKNNQEYIVEFLNTTKIDTTQQEILKSFSLL